MIAHILKRDGFKRASTSLSLVLAVARLPSAGLAAFARPAFREIVPASILRAPGAPAGGKLIGMLAILLLVLASAMAAPSDVSGNWRVEFATPTGDFGTTVTLNQNGGKLTGRAVNEDGEFPVEGTVADDQVTFMWTVPEQGGQMQITVKGKVDGEYINGTARLGNVGEGSMSARRVSRNP
jgi:hypothetical protein